MRQQFKDLDFRGKSLDLIEKGNAILAEFAEQGVHVLTLRQLYYQFVSRNFIENTERSYKNLAALFSNARLAGLVDWSAIEDRGRVPQAAGQWDSIREIVDSAIAQFRLPRWADQPNHVELWVEKQALAGVLWPLAREAHVTLMVNKGYSSTSAMYDAAQRMAQHETQECFVLYLGDHDPSGEDMVRDVQERFNMFGQRVEVKKIALTWAQIQAQKPPPNPAKLTDPRAAEYIARHGPHSWELDALSPTYLNRLVRSEIGKLIDRERFDEVIAEEQRQREALNTAMKKAEI